MQNGGAYSSGTNAERLWEKLVRTQGISKQTDCTYEYTQVVIIKR